MSYDTEIEDYLKAIPDSRVIYCKYVGDYQGDLFILVQKAGEWGIVVHGYGSCSGCDEYEACDNDEQRIALAHRIVESGTYFATKDELADWLVGRDYAGLYFGQQDGIVIAMLDFLVKPTYSETVIALVANEECLPEIIADRLEEDAQQGYAAYPHTIKGLRYHHSKWAVKGLMRKVITGITN